MLKCSKCCIYCWGQSSHTQSDSVPVFNPCVITCFSSLLFWPVRTSTTVTCYDCSQISSLAVKKSTFSTCMKLSWNVMSRILPRPLWGLSSLRWCEACQGYSHECQDQDQERRTSLHLGLRRKQRNVDIEWQFVQFECLATKLYNWHRGVGLYLTEFWGDSITKQHLGSGCCVRRDRLGQARMMMTMMTTIYLMYCDHGCDHGCDWQPLAVGLQAAPGSTEAIQGFESHQRGQQRWTHSFSEVPTWEILSRT